MKRPQARQRKRVLNVAIFELERAAQESQNDGYFSRLLERSNREAIEASRSDAPGVSQMMTRGSLEVARSRGNRRYAVGPAIAQWRRDVRAGRVRNLLAQQPHQKGSRGAPSVGQEVGAPPARSTSATKRAARRATAGRVVDRAPTNTPGRPVPRGSRGGTGGAEATALASGGGAPQSPPGFSELRRPPGFAGRGLELPVLAVYGVKLRVSSGPKSVGPPGQPRAQLSQRDA